jgi:uncharacterized protein (DUF885 family)
MRTTGRVTSGGMVLDKASNATAGVTVVAVATSIYELCDAYIERAADLDPVMATSRGLIGHDGQMTDYSPEGVDARTGLDRATIRELDGLQPGSDRDRIAGDLLAERLRSSLSLDDAGETLGALRIIGSPFQAIRAVFDVMPRASEADWAIIAARLDAVPGALKGVRAALTESARRGMPAARRQVLACAQQGATWSGSDGHRPFFPDLVARYPGSDTDLARRLETGAAAASEAYASISAWLRDDLASEAREKDAVGRDRYAVLARQHLGAEPDLDETYAWGWSELHRLEAEMLSVADRIVPGAPVAEVIAVLESDPDRAIHGEDALRGYLQDLMDRTIDELDGVHFDIPTPLRAVEAMIAPPGTAAAMYYTGPAEDFSRPGRTWYPTLGKTVFPLWGEVSVCYHEGVPGHHLQIGQVRYRKDDLTRFQRVTGVSGHAEGWALYAERLMDELGYLDNPEYRLGFLRAQVLRAVRVVVDIGMHLELTIPSDDRFHPGERWTPELGREFVVERSCFPADFMASELDRYLGWPGQAICYKVGERVWLAARDEVRRRAGTAFDLKSFHARALDAGPLGLDQLAKESATFGTS